MRVHDFVDEGLGHSSYVIDLGNDTAAVIDPPRFPIAHEQLTERQGLRVVWTIDTHSHADYVTGSPGLAARRVATFIAPAASRLETPHLPVTDGARVELARGIFLVAIATSGHTPDHHSYVLEENGIPLALFSGGSLMVGTVGRTDLCGPDLAEALAHEMFRGLRRFDNLPADVAVYPTHGAGSFCSAPGASLRTSTLGHEHATNPLFSIGDEDLFVERLVAGFGTFPTYFDRLPELNRLGPTRYDSMPELAQLTTDDVQRHLESGAVIVDARPAAPSLSVTCPGHCPTRCARCSPVGSVGSWSPTVGSSSSSMTARTVPTSFVSALTSGTNGYSASSTAALPPGPPPDCRPPPFRWSAPPT